MKKEIFSISDISTINDQMVEIPGGAIGLRDDRIKHQWTVVIAPKIDDLGFRIARNLKKK